MTKSEMINEIGTKTNFDKKDITTVVNMAFDLISSKICSGEKVSINGFGSFTTAEKGPAVKRNPRTGGTVNVPAKTVPRFKFSKSLKDKVANI